MYIPKQLAALQIKKTNIADLISFSNHIQYAFIHTNAFAVNKISDFQCKTHIWLKQFPYLTNF